MNKFLLFSLLTFAVHYNYLFSTDLLDEFQEKLHAEQIDFSYMDLQDIESVKTAISAMYELDQGLRIAYIHDRNNLGLQHVMLEMDRFHTQVLQKIIELHGWLTIDKFGKQADSQAWLLVQHADDDIGFQKYCLQLLEKALQEKQTSPAHYAYLYDRVALNSEEYGYKQRYGTQLSMTDDGQFIIRSYEGSLEDVDKRRQEVGLSTLAQYKELIANMYKNS